MIRRVGSFVLTVAVAVMIVSAVSQAQSVLTRHTRDAVVNGVAPSIGRLPVNQEVKFDIVLALRHAPELENFLQDIYDSNSPNYRHFLTPAQFAERFGASREDYDAVVQWAKSHGFQVVGGSFEGRNVALKGSSGAVERALHVTMNVYQHPTESRTFFAPNREPQLDLPFAVWHVSGLDNFSRPKSMLRHKDSGPQAQVVKGSCPGNFYCGSDMRGAYYGNGALTGTGQNIALLELAGTNLSDLAKYYTNAHQTQPYVPTLVSAGGYGTACNIANGCDDAEQTLDMTQAMGMAPGSTMLYHYVCGDAFVSGTFSDTACLSAMVSTTSAPLSYQISSSWSWKPADPQTDDPYFQQMAAQGQSFFDAAGDSGRWVANSFAYPAEDVWVTAVGGTDLIVANAGGPWQSETSWSSSGGGISPDHFAIPAYQQLTGVINAQNKGSSSFRNAPDVAAESNFDFYVCYDQGTCQGGFGGTSFAAPMWAGFMALVNQQAGLSSKPPVGFINPAIYQIGIGGSYTTVFHDITVGSNGLPAVAGYDLVTGWGSPQGAAFINALVGSGGGGGPAVSLSATSLAWGKVLVGKTTGGKKVTLTNTGNAPLAINTITVSGDFAFKTIKQTKKVTPCVNGTTVPAAGTCVFSVTFTPTQTGARTGQVTITDNATDSPQHVALSGTGK